MDLDSQSSAEDSDDTDDNFIPPKESTTRLRLFPNIEQVYNPRHTGEYDKQETVEDDIPIPFLNACGNVATNPAKELLRGGQRRTKGMRMETIFAGFKERLIAHPISDIGSQQHACLQRLMEKFNLFQCQAEIGIYANQNTENQHPPFQDVSDPEPLTSNQTSPNTSNVHVPTEKTAAEEGMAIFCAYMRLLMPLANGRDTTVSDPTVEIVSSNLDFLLPFHQCALTMQKAMETIYSEPRQLLTQAGLFNAIAFCAVFYGSEYAKQSLHFFDLLNEWAEYHASVEQEKGTTDTVEYKRQVRERREAKARQKKDVASEMSERQKRLHTGPTERGSHAGWCISDAVCIGMGLPCSKTETRRRKGTFETRHSVVLQCQRDSKAFVDLDRHMLKDLTKDEHKAIKYNIITLEHSLYSGRNQQESNWNQQKLNTRTSG
ncbi:uncharacterized protein LACBIDRAFT_333846 [Laccaria bicolor S238N-H82]|uniref:Predicted protein n=1 Tax=Laccaria bicolor (strain S238N-H82 / ATCC MYA-4686) TaxID=486041 RepID=B0DX97_LACBS|nr:uncharacterized protein LACBIDRAFT_333846 [Laccaria bicolor S238N-H82]EDR00755.1 predicted protein [Laccaria bicolor S238N-H82]|eukprot:XP_001888547.1 predicted protein [Laccaria bicolor S238N-H82]